MATRCTCTAFLTLFAVIVAGLLSFYVAGSSITWPVVSLTVVVGLVSLWLRRRDTGTDRRVCVLVLGDIGRSPRMQYHALSLSKHAYNVTFVGFLGKNEVSYCHLFIHLFPLYQSITQKLYLTLLINTLYGRT